MERITVFGGGATGYVLSVDLGLRGYHVCLCEEPCYEDSLSAAKKHMQISIAGPSVNGIGKLGMVTTDLRKALNWSDLLIVCTVSNRDSSVAKALVPYLHPGHKILLSAGNFGSFLYRKVFDEAGIEGVIVGETCGNLYPARITGEAQTVVGGVISSKPAAAWPNKDTEALLEAFQKIYPIHRAPNILFCALDVGNMMSHICPVIMNAGAIEKAGGRYYLFRQGITPAILAVEDALWKEKKALMDALGYPASPSLSEFFAPLLDDNNHSMDFFKNLEGPNSLSGRHITEDTPILDCLLISVAAAMNVEVPLFRSFVNIASAMHKTDYYAQGRTLENLGLGDLKGQDLINYFNHADCNHKSSSENS